MPDLSPATVPQVLLSLALLNVWLLRATSSTRYRGRDARTLQEEFRVYGLPPWSFFVLGALKLGCSGLRLAGLWMPALVLRQSASSRR